MRRLQLRPSTGKVHTTTLGTLANRVGIMYPQPIDGYDCISVKKHISSLFGSFFERSPDWDTEVRIIERTPKITRRHMHDTGGILGGFASYRVDEIWLRPLILIFLEPKPFDSVTEMLNSDGVRIQYDFLTTTLLHEAVHVEDNRLITDVVRKINGPDWRLKPLPTAITGKYMTDEYIRHRAILEARAEFLSAIGCDMVVKLENFETSIEERFSRLVKYYGKRMAELRKNKIFGIACGIVHAACILTAAVAGIAQGVFGCVIPNSLAMPLYMGLFISAAFASYHLMKHFNSNIHFRIIRDTRDELQKLIDRTKKSDPIKVFRDHTAEFVTDVERAIIDFNSKFES
jgi:hypothetical protein